MSLALIEPKQSLASARSVTTIEHYMETLCTEDERIAPTRDLGSVVRKYHEFSTKALSQVNYLVTTPKFHAWLIGADSDILLVDGHCGNQSIGKIAPTSVFCAGLIETLSDPLWDPERVSLPHQPRMVVYFFAGQHANSGHSLLGPCGLMRSLIDQVLLQWPKHRSLDLAYREAQHETRTDAWGCDIPELCCVFERLISQLERDTSIFCVIDGISYFETALRGWVDDLKEIVECFLRCVDRSHGNRETSSVKMLLLSADKSTAIRHMIPTQYHMDLRAGNFHSQSQGWNVLRAH